MTIVLIIAAVWVLCGFVNYGLFLGHFTHRFPSGNHFGDSILIGCAGIFGVPAMLSSTPYHWRLKPMTTEERWAYFKKENPTLGREYFERTHN